jgi:hypothetical protein
MPRHQIRDIFKWLMSPRLTLVVALGLFSSGCRSGSQAPVVYPDGTLMQAADTKIVYIIWDGKRRQVPDPQTLEALSISGQVSTQPREVIASIPEREPIPHLPGKVVQKGSTGEVFILEAGKRRWIPDPETLEALGGAGQVHGVPDSVADAIPLGPPMAHMNKSDVHPGKGNQ